MNRNVIVFFSHKIREPKDGTDPIWRWDVCTSGRREVMEKDVGG
jgi:hypothetical protein